MHQNQVSYKTKQQNLLKSKTQSFLQNYSDSFERVKARSSMHKLAGTVYSAQQNSHMFPKKTASKSVIFPLIKFENPEISHSQAIKGLNVRASHIPNYSDINTQLILQKKNLEEKMAFLKDEILRENKLNNKSEMNSRKLNNELERANNSIKEMNIKSERLNEGINEAKEDCSNLRNNLNDLISDNNNTENEINNEKNNCSNLEGRCRVLKKNLLNEDKMRNDLKAQLIKKQKVMTSCSILTKELQHQRAVLLLEINKFVSLNKLP